MSFSKEVWKMDQALESTSLDLDSHHQAGTSYEGPLNIDIIREMTGRDTMYFRNFFEEPKRKRAKKN